MRRLAMEEGGRGLGVATEEIKWLEKVSRISCGSSAQSWSDLRILLILFVDLGGFAARKVVGLSLPF